ncbi:Histone-lysine N-methyltransferase EZ1 [Frankliniella fusca]|uniref:Histone-lysine N-methyltransferase EZ1 n=1 Tax=Frankliniella fusca TaxID=407009 RepID=A0AAE1HDB6_9NEOP|nr:Histone-lysine N-methyltransferase EZ1 [Frankliniella fusca]
MSYEAPVDKENVAPNPAKRRRSSNEIFDPKLQCFYCGSALEHQFGDKTPVGKREQVKTVLREDALKSVLEKAESVGGETGDKVRLRVLSVLDPRGSLRYHVKCYKNFKPQPQQKNPGRPLNESLRSAFDMFCEELEADPECQFSMSEMTLKFSEMSGDDEGYSSHHLKKLLKDRYGDSVIFTDFGGKNSVFCFRGKANKFVYDSWHEERNSRKESDRDRILRAAVKIINEDIRSRAYDMENYLIGGDLDEEYLVPDSLRFFLSGLILSKSTSRQVERTRETLAQSIMQASRPRSYISPIQLNLALYLHQTTASRLVIDVLHSLGLCSSYAEVDRFTSCFVNSGRPSCPASAPFKQWAFDNADYNTKTLTGHGTFHEMGGIACSTPCPPPPPPYTIPRLKGKITLDVSKGRMPIRQYVKPPLSGFKNLEIKDVGVSRTIASLLEAQNIDFLWMSSFCIPKPMLLGTSTPSWNAYMVTAHTQCGPYDVSQVEFLPFINLDPNNLTCIFTALDFALRESTRHGLEKCFVTMDLPLFMKASEIVLSTSSLKQVVVMLGGFHLMMSFLGCIGEISKGSGLEELLAEVYAKNTVPHIISGHAYARAMRAHSLAQQALSVLMLKEDLAKETTLLLELADLHRGIMENSVPLSESMSNPAVKTVQDIVIKKCDTLAQQNRTSLFWVEYFKQVEISRLFIQAVRVGNWNLYLDSMRAMLPYFHAAGHLPYAKGVHIHLQRMDSLESEMAVDEFEMFTSRGFFSVRHSDAFFKGVPMDLTIEQKLMRNFKTSGLTTGRGITERTVAKFVTALSLCIPLKEKLENFCGVRHESSEQHVEQRRSRIARDERDLNRLLEWLAAHPPFEERPAEMLVSISTGLVADGSINCDKAWEVGLQAVQEIHGNNFADVKLKRKNKVRNLAAMNNNITVQGEKISINPSQLLHRITCVLNTQGGDLSQYLEYELSPSPPNLFDNDGAFRKTEKSALAAGLSGMCAPDVSPPQNVKYVVDGGMVLRHMVWPRPATYGQICSAYKSFVTRRYGSDATVVFDGYENTHLSTKAQEQLRRVSGKTSPTVSIQAENVAASTQTHFLGNSANKANLIRMLTPVLRSAGLRVLQHPADADSLTVETALELAGEGARVVIAGNDTDLLAMAVQRTLPGMEIWVLAPGTSGRADKVHNIAKLQEVLGASKECLLFAHALTGSDTTSAMHGKGKLSILKLLQTDEQLQAEVCLFNEENANIEKLVEIGERVIRALFNGSSFKTLNELRLFLYHRMAANKKLDTEFTLKTLPPTSAGARQHILRVYLTVQNWLGRELDPTRFGWQKQGDRLLPIPSELGAAPDCLLKVIRCGCTKGCTVNCECKKAGLPCRLMCSGCQGQCSNTAPIDLEDPDEDIDDPC